MRSRQSLTNVSQLRDAEMRLTRRHKADVTVLSFSNDPIGFAKYLGVEFLTDEQKQIMLSVRDRSVTNVQAAHGVGKLSSQVFWCCGGYFRLRECVSQLLPRDAK